MFWVITNSVQCLYVTLLLWQCLYHKRNDCNTTFPWYYYNITFDFWVTMNKMSDIIKGILLKVYTSDNLSWFCTQFQSIRLIFSPKLFGLSCHEHNIKYLWQFGLNRSLKLQKINCKKNPLCTRVVCFQMPEVLAWSLFLDSGFGLPNFL